MESTSDFIQQGYDELNYRSDTALAKLLGPGEQVLLSTILYKYNKRSKRQERSILITSKAIYNVNKQGIIASIINLFNSNYQVRRRIDIMKLSAISVSDISSEFVLHVPDEYDYRYASPEKRDRILTVLCRAFVQNHQRPLIFFFKNDINLTNYTTTEDDAKIQVSRIPTDESLALNEDTLRAKLNEVNQAKEKLRAKTMTVFNKVAPSVKVTLDDFDILKVLGRGAFGKVMLVEMKKNKQVYAMKSLHKEEIIDKDQIEHTKTERFVLERSKSPFLVNLVYAFQTPDKIFFVMTFMKGGELFQHLRANKRFDEKRAKFYAAQILLGIEYLHDMGVIYRDLKPENVLMDEEGHVCLTDFGMAKEVKEGELTRSFVGTPEYLAPEVIAGKGHGKPVDWWALGILVFEMLIGMPPFYSRDQNHQQMFITITKKEVDFGTRIKISPEAKSLILNLLKKNPNERLGTKGVQEIKDHPWFDDIDWNKMSEKKLPPPFKPKVKNDRDVNNFDDEFTSEQPCNSVIPNGNTALVKKHQKEFQDFTYIPKNGLLNEKEKGQ